MASTARQEEGDDDTAAQGVSGTVRAWCPPLSRFYGLEVAADLFGEWCLTRRWGRIGSAGRRQVKSFTSREQAEETLRQFLAAKQRRGYRLR